jgi:hypothetical protein
VLCQTKLPRSCATAAERGDADGRPIVFEVGADRFAIDYAITELNQKTGAQRCGLPYRLSTITRKKTWHRSQPPSQQTRQPSMRSPKAAGWRSRKNLV